MSLSRTPEYLAWSMARDRCHNPKSHAYARYGGRGIYMEPRWRESFNAFLQDMGPRPPAMTLERRNNDGPYSKDNCRWATRVDQNNNKRVNHRLTFDGQTMTVAQWARHIGISPLTLRTRLFKNKWPLEKALKPNVRRTFLTIRGETLPLVTWSRRLGISRETLKHRLAHNWSEDDIFNTPPHTGNRKHRP